MAVNNTTKQMKKELDLADKILSKWGETEAVKKQIKKLSKETVDISDNLYKGAKNQLDKEKNILSIIQDKSEIFLNDLKSSKKLNASQSRTVGLLEEQIKNRQIIIDKLSTASSWVEELVDRIPFIGEEMKASLSDALKNAMMPLFDKFATFQQAAISSFQKMGLIGKASIVAIIAATVAAIKIFYQWEDATVNMMKNLGATRESTKDIIKSAKKAYSQLAKYGIESDAVLESTEALVKEFGTMSNITPDLIKDSVAISEAWGLGADNAAKFIKLQTKSLGLSREQLEINIKMLKAMSDQYGVSAGIVAGDLVDAADQVAMFADGTSMNMERAAIFARRLGTNIGTISSLADSLLDIESSTEKAAAASAFLGSTIDLSRARYLALNKDIEGATRAILQQFGEFDRTSSSFVPKIKALSELLGVGAEEASSMWENFKHVDDVVTPMVTDLNKIMKTPLSEALGLGDTLGLIKQIWGKLKGIITPILLPIVGLFTVLLKSVNMILDGIYGIASAVEKALKKSTIMRSIWTYMGRVFKNISTIFSNSIIPLVSNLNSGFSGVLKIIAGAGGLIASFIVIKKLLGGVFGGTFGKILSGGFKLKGGGMLKGLFGTMNPVILLKIGAGVAIIGGAMWVLGKAMQEFAKAAVISTTFFESMSKLDAGNLLKSAGAVTAMGVAMAAFGSGSVISGVGTIVGKLLGGDLFAKFSDLAVLAPQLNEATLALKSMSEVQYTTIATGIQSLVKPMENFASAANKAKSAQLGLAGAQAATGITSVISGIGNKIGSLISGGATKTERSSNIQITPANVVLDGQKVGQIVFSIMQGEA